ncbi:hypothetical protein M758_5G153700 [Ceratodon purpureus]|nr:hypothetical protein M758_5G153700 [Ceratodon purpureus]
MTTSMVTSLPCSHSFTSFAQSGRVSASALGVGVAPVGLGAGLRGGVGNGQCSSSWTGGELRRQVFGQRRAVALPNSGRRALKIVAEEKTDVFKAAGFIVKAGKNALDAGTDLVPDTIPRGVARIIVGIVGAAVVTYALRALFSTALFVLAIGGFSYLAYIYVSKDKDSGSGGGGGGGSGSSRNTDDSLDEARRIMDKYK